VHIQEIKTADLGGSLFMVVKKKRITTSFGGLTYKTILSDPGRGQDCKWGGKRLFIQNFTR
jgi:hypothetical protein